MITKAQSWDDIENRFLVDFGGTHIRMLTLVKHIQNSDFSKRLFGSTSMDKLIVSNDDQIDYNKESIHITFDLNKNV